MSSTFHIVMKNNKGTCVLMYVVLHGIAQIPAGKAQHLSQNELNFSYSDEKQQRHLCAYVCCFAWNSPNSSGEGSKSSSNSVENFHIMMQNNKGTCVLMYVVLHGTAQIPVGKAQNLAQNELKFS